MAIELEVKILNINPEDEEKKIIKKGGKRKKEVLQKIYTYDIWSMYSRFKEIIQQLKSDNSIKNDINYDKLKNLFWEIDNYELSQDLSFLNISNVFCLEDILKCKNWKALVMNSKLDVYLRKFDINPCKWIRLRKTNNEVTLAVKHILDNKGEKVQNLMETEITVSSFEETDKLLQQLGLVHKNYQEKKRIMFEIEGHEIDFDFWPGIPPFMEFEGETVDDLKKITELLEYSMDDVVSCTADEIYRLYGKDMQGQRMLTFENIRSI